jgi:hypothetical protein
LAISSDPFLPTVRFAFLITAMSVITRDSGVPR